MKHISARRTVYRDSNKAHKLTISHFGIKVKQLKCKSLDTSLMISFHEIASAMSFLILPVLWLQSSCDCPL
ncbi:hypothetical protein PNOK_0677200 [Pyrrhoderma noxium]|uniref:Uncharacterized protein n=1 Tax=Pyrrhoderma noxium TaxID=2282107 RepID=A0A286UFA6_9AGAM|nr:hypothetical protein PNOK_0677200 [Pyrrhoderma noxium]